jgi:hypothetical protein
MLMSPAIPAQEFNVIESALRWMEPELLEQDTS